MAKLSNKEDFIKKSKLVHGEYFNYSKVEYVNNNTKVIINCPVHGDFEQIPRSHTFGIGCKLCKFDSYKHTQKDIVKEFSKVHGNQYDYSLVKYNNSHQKVDIICLEHGIFKQTPEKHKRGHGCRKCNIRFSLDKVLEHFKLTHGDRYDYSHVKYISDNIKIKIICREHGLFEQTPSNHKKNKGCPRCDKSFKLNQEDVITQFKNTHGDKFDYSKTIYLTNHEKVTIICAAHGEFKQTPASHKSGTGCPNCKSSKGENKLNLFLIKNKIEFKQEYKFENNNYSDRMPFDFYLPKHNLCIEYNGIQHYEPIDFFGGIKSFKSQTKRDKIKIKYCKENNINLLIIKYDQNIEEVLNDYFFG